MKKFLTGFFKEEEGQGMAEYALSTWSYCGWSSSCACGIWRCNYGEI